MMGRSIEKPSVKLNFHIIPFIENKTMGDRLSGGQVVSMLTFYSGDSSLNPALYRVLFDYSTLVSIYRPLLR